MIFSSRHEEHLRRVALICSDSGRSWDYAQLRAQAADLAAAMRLPRKALAFCFCRNDAASVIAYLACLRSETAVCLLDSSAKPALKRQLIEAYRPDFLLEPLSARPQHAGLGDDYALVAEHSSQAGLWRRKSLCALDLNPLLAVLLSTSGTTGCPKLVRLSTANIEANAHAICHYLGIAPQERAIASLPFYYSYGLSVLNSHLLAGASVVLSRHSIIRPEFWEAFRAHGCSSFAGVPSSYEMIARIGMETFLLPTLRTMTQAGGRMAEPLILKFDALMKSRGGRLFVMYGQTEATARIAYLPPERLPAKVGAVGIAVPGGKLSVRNADGPVSAPRTIGEIVYSGPNVMLGYAQSVSDLQLGDTMHGELRTGDLGYFDEDGLLFLTGRLKRFSKIYGLRVNLDEIEAFLKDYGATAVVGNDDRITVFCDFGDESLHAALRQKLSEAYQLNVNTFEFQRIAVLPLKSTGKIDYDQLAQQAYGRH